MARRMEEIKMDIADLDQLLEKATRSKSKDLLGLEIRKLQTELINLQNQVKSESNNDGVVNNIIKPTIKCYEVKLNNYAWDQTNDFIKIYVTLNNVQHAAADSINCTFTDRSLHLTIKNLDSKNYTLSINNLSEDIIPDNSNYKVKTNMVVMNLAKKSKTTWQCITGVEKRLKESKANFAAEASDTSDPEKSLMSLMKKMYQEGDDDTKRTIAKAWTESQEKRLQPDMDF